MNSEEIHQQLLGGLDRILLWVKLGSIANVREYFSSVLDTPKKRRVYDLTDGVNSIPDIKRQVEVATGTLHSWWIEWERKGLVIEAAEYKGRKEKIIALSELGLEE